VARRRRAGAGLTFGAAAGQRNQSRSQLEQRYIVPLAGAEQLPKCGISAVPAPPDEYPHRRIECSTGLLTAPVENPLARQAFDHLLTPSCNELSCHAIK